MATKSQQVTSNQAPAKQKSNGLKKPKFSLVAVAIFLFIGIALFLSRYENTTPVWLKGIGIVVCICIITFAALRNLTWFKIGKISLPKIDNTVKKAATWIVILVCIIFIAAFIPWKKVTLWKGSKSKIEIDATRFYDARPDSLKLKIGEWNVLRKGQSKYFLKEKKLRYEDPIFEGMTSADTVYAYYKRVAPRDHIDCEVKWATGMPVHINGFPYGTKEEIPEWRAPDFIPFYVDGCYEVSYNGPQKEIKMFIKSY